MEISFEYQKRKYNCSVTRFFTAHGMCYRIDEVKPELNVESKLYYCVPAGHALVTGGFDDPELQNALSSAIIKHCEANKISLCTL